jgi:hypothetical protein
MKKAFSGHWSIITEAIYFLFFCLAFFLKPSVPFPSGCLYGPEDLTVTPIERKRSIEALGIQLSAISLRPFD